VTGDVRVEKLLVVLIHSRTRRTQLVDVVVVLIGNGGGHEHTLHLACSFVTIVLVGHVPCGIPDRLHVVLVSGVGSILMSTTAIPSRRAEGAIQARHNCLFILLRNGPDCRIHRVLEVGIARVQVVTLKGGGEVPLRRCVDRAALHGTACLRLQGVLRPLVLRGDCLSGVVLRSALLILGLEVSVTRLQRVLQRPPRLVCRYAFGIA
jgi:hypothetical protein